MNVEDLFVRTEGAFRTDGIRGAVAIGCLGAGLAVAWAYWALAAEVQQYEVSSSARIELRQAATPLQVDVSGKVVQSFLQLDRHVVFDEVLVTLKDEEEDLRLTEDRTKQQVLSQEIAALAQQISSVKQAAEEDTRATAVAREQAEAELRQAVAERERAEADYEQQKRLHDEGLTALSEFRRYQTELATRRATEQRLAAGVEQVDAQHRLRQREREAHLDELRVDMRRLEGQIRTAGAAVGKSQYDKDNRQLRAPVGGILGEVRELRAGTYVEAGELLGYVLPAGDFQVAADFPPAAAVGRIKTGQPARLRLDGFSWVQYGSIEAEVTGIAQEIRGGTIRVECRLVGDPPPGLQLQHGLPGTLEVLVEKAPPAELALRAAGRLVTEPRSWFTSTTTD